MFMKRSNRRAPKGQAEPRERCVEVFAAFANTKNGPADRHKFQARHPKFFPDQFFAEDLTGNPLLTKVYEVFSTKKFILWRDIVRSFWTNNATSMDRLFGMGVYARDLLPLMEDMFALCRENPALNRYGHLWVEMMDLSVTELPPIKLVLDKVSGKLRREFACELQQGFYLLMEKPWRKKVCPICKRYFVANETGRIYCGTVCTGRAKCKRGNVDWQRRGSDRRRELRKIERDKERSTSGSMT
jgi:hypothetical protein